MKTLIMYWGRTGGGAHYATELANNLLLLSKKDYLLSFSRGNEFFNKLKTNENHFHVSTYSNAWQFVFKTLQLPFLLIKFAFYLKRQKIKQVICPMSHLWNIPVILVAKLLGVEYVLVVHDGVPHPGDDIAFRGKMLMYEIRLADKIITLSSAVRDLIESKYNIKKPIVVVPHGIMEYGVQGERKFPVKMNFNILFFGRILKYKGLEVLIESFKKIPNENLVLSIYGKGDFDYFTEDFRDDKRIKLINRWIKEDEIPEIFNNADLVVLPYIEASQSGVIPIALSSGVPIIASDVGGLFEQLDNGKLGLTFPKCNTDVLKDKILELVTNKELYELKSRIGFQYAKSELLWSSIAKKIHEFVR